LVLFWGATQNQKYKPTKVQIKDARESIPNSPKAERALPINLELGLSNYLNKLMMKRAEFQINLANFSKHKKTQID
jgi:hypothetical protein